MDNQQIYSEHEVPNTQDIEYSKPTKSRFLFVLFFFGFFIFCWAGCYNLYEHKFQKNEDIPAPGNTLYEPVYK